MKKYRSQDEMNNYQNNLLFFQTVRKVFEDCEFFAKQIGQPVELVERFKLIWQCLTSGLPISPTKFGVFGKETKGTFPYI